MIVRYSSFADKAARYQRETIPQIFQSAKAAQFNRQYWAVEGSGAAVHESIRRGKYVPEEGAQDDVQAVAYTEQHGGDCEDWAAVQLQEFARRNIPARLVTAGSPTDNFEHAYVEFFDGQRWIPSDPKGSQRGKDLGVRSSHAVTRRWTLDGSTPVEVPAGSGADALDAQAALYVAKSATASGPAGYQTWMARLKSDQFGPKQIVSAALAARINASAPVTYTGGTPGSTPQPGTAQAVEAQQAALVLVNDDKFVSYWLAAQLPLAQLFDIANAMNISGDEGYMRGALADLFTTMAKGNGWTVRRLVTELGGQAPNQDDPALSVVGVTNAPPGEMQPLGSGSLFGKLGDAFDKAGEIFRAVQTGVGVALQQLGRSVLILGDRQPWFNQFISKPLGFHLVSTAMAEIGNAIVDGSINTFDETKFTRAAGSWFTAVGTALATAAPFTGPWAPLFAACGAINVGIGKTINGLVDRTENARLMRESGGIASQQTYQVDAQGRVVDLDGMPLDPTERQLELVHRAKLQARGLERGPDGNWYGYANFGPEWGQLWTVHNSAGQAFAAVVNDQWVSVQ